MRLDCLLKFLFRRKQRKHQNSASLAFVREIHRGPVNSPHKGPVTRNMFPFDDVIMNPRTHGIPKLNNGPQDHAHILRVIIRGNTTMQRHLAGDLRHDHPDSNVHGAKMGPTWGRQDPGGSQVGHVNFAIWVNVTMHHAYIHGRRA